MLAGIFIEREYASTSNNNTNSNGEIIEVSYIIDKKSEIDEGSNCDMKEYYFVVDDVKITNFHKEEDGRNFIRKDCKYESWEEAVDEEKIQVPTDTDNYNGPHRLKLIEENRFENVL